MRRCSLLFLGLSGCLVQDAAWEPPADTDAHGTSGLSSSSSTAFSSEGTAGGSGESTGEDSASGGAPGDGLPTDCAPLPSLPSDAQVVGSADNGTLHTIFADAAPGTTIALEPGTYDRSEQPTLIISAAGVVVRSTTGDPSDVVLDGGSTGMSTLLSIRADAVLLAEFTMQGASDTLIQICLLYTSDAADD
ncbi:MAG: hypothetical protein KUG77_20790 [Nannocystaceae bacterium]|nr:hypothetical protein [Nannocystaceae bacterium]